jgi:tetratricopeptide (TPR) repeat protein
VRHIAPIVIALFSAQEQTLERARALARNGRTAQAIALLEGRARADPRAPELSYLAELYAAEGGVPQAVSALERALDVAPGENGLRVTLGAMLFQLRRYEEARGELETAIAGGGRSALAHYYLASVERGLSRLESAERSASRAVELSPPPARSPLASLAPSPSVASRHLLAEIRFELGKDAEPLLRDVLAVEPELASAHYLLARLLQRRGDLEEALAEFRRFDALKRADAHLAQGLDLSRLGRTGESLLELERAVAACPDHARALFLLGRELVRAGRAEQAQQLLERALALRPDAAAEIASLR